MTKTLCGPLTQR